MVNIYKLSLNFKNLVLNKGYKTYKSSDRQLEHDYLLLKVYSNLSYNEQRNWVNETFLKSKYGDRYKYTTDGMFFIKDKKVAVEIITSKYTKSLIKSKQDFIKRESDESIWINVKDYNKL